MAIAENERPSPIFGLERCASNGEKIMATPIITLALNHVQFHIIISLFIRQVMANETRQEENLVVQTRVFEKFPVFLRSYHTLVALFAQQIF